MISKVCINHGELLSSQIRKYIRNRRGRSEITFGCKLCHRATASQARNKDRTKANEWNRKDRILNPEKHRNWSAKARKKLGDKRNKIEISRRRGLTLQQYEQMFLDQKGLCSICQNPETRKSRTEGKITNLCVDHCHVTNKVRGLLCHACNTALGKFKDKIETLEAAIDYLRMNE